MKKKWTQAGLNLLLSLSIVSISYASSVIWGDAPGQETEAIILDEKGAALGPEEATAAIEKTTAVYGSQKWVSILCKFRDVAVEPITASFARSQYEDPALGLNAYWREVSGNSVDLSGSTAFGWMTLPQTRAYYTQPGLSLQKLANDCTAAANAAQFDFSPFVHVAMFFNAEMDGRAFGGAMTLDLNGIRRKVGVLWAPPWAYENLSYLSHEMGHAFGLPHSSGKYGNTYDNQWDVMSYPRLCKPINPVYGCTGQHTIEYHKDRLGWIPAYQKRVISPGADEVLYLKSTEDLSGTEYRYLVIPTQGTSFYTIAARRPAQFDAGLPGKAIIIHEVNPSRGIPANVIDADGNHYNGDAGAMWTVGESFVDEENQIAISILSMDEYGFTVRVVNRPATFTAIIGADKTEGSAPMDVQFQAFGLGGQPPYSIQWDFSNGLTSLFETPAVTFEEPGSNLVSLVMQDATGAVSRATDLTVNVVSSALFYDSFNKDASAWNMRGNSWNISEGSLWMPGKTTAVAEFAGCSICSLESVFEMEESQGKITFYGWYRDKQNNVELVIDAAKQAWTLRERIGGVVTSSRKTMLQLIAKVPYRIRLSYDGESFRLAVNQQPVAILKSTAVPYGTIGAGYKPGHNSSGGSARIHRILVEL